MHLPAPWFDPDRWPQRRFAARPGVVLQPAAAAETLAQLTEAWAALLDRPTDDLLVCASAAEAAALLPGSVLQPGDVVVLAAPAPEAAIAAVLRSGARFVDVSRSHTGTMEPAAVGLTLRHHPDAWLLLTDHDADPVQWPVWRQAGARPERTLRWDTARLAGCGPVPAEQAPLGTVVALLDPAAPQQPLLWGLLTAGATPALRGLVGTPALHPLVASAAAQAIAQWQGDTGLRDALQARLAAAAVELQSAVAGWPGAVLWSGSGVWRLVRCAAGDGPALAAALAAAGWDARATACAAVGSAVEVGLWQRAAGT